MFCSKCGASNADASASCASCGAALAGSVPGATAGPDVFAGFWIRAGAYVIDSVLLTVASFVLVAVAALAPSAEMLIVLAYLLTFLVAPWLYSALMASSASQGTVGKLAVGLRVADLQGNRVSFGRATGRFFAEWVTGLTLGVGYLMPLFTSKRQTLHDKIAGTVVVRGKPEPASIATAPAARNAHPLVIVAAVLATSVPLIGIVAAVAIPAYHDYTVRAQVMEGLVLASNLKAGVAEHAMTVGEWPADLDEMDLRSNMEDAAAASQYVRSIEVLDGTITITYGRNANARIRNARLSLRPFVTEDDDIAWQCGNAQVLDIEESGSGAGRTDVEDRHLPMACRSSQ
jgi:uncharacterized RDD family membrane protein YckC/Tfp pilus assembly major pilin PilA